MEKPGNFSRKYLVRVDETDADSRLTMLSLFGYMQDLICAQVADIKIGLNDLNRKGLTWVLSRAKIEMEYCPEYGDCVLAETWAGPIKRYYVPRHVLFRSVNTGNVVARASTFWLMLDLKSFAPMDPVLYYPSVQEDHTQPEFFGSAGTIKSTPGSGPLEFRAFSSQIDINNHVNNRYFPTYIQDWIAEEIRCPVRLVSLCIHFNSVIRFEERTICSGEINGRDFRTVGYSPDGKNIFAASGSFERIHPKLS